VTALVAASTHAGLVHFPNEDSWARVDTEDGGQLLMVCDGMGGMGRGDEASQLAVAELTQRLSAGDGSPPERLAAALRATDHAVRHVLCTGEDGYAGSTAVLVYLLEGLAHVAWVGDSRAYLVRGGQVADRTRDHKLVNELVDAGELTQEEARHSSFSNVITRALGGRPLTEPTVEPECKSHPWVLERDDVVLLCSDGLADLVEDDELPFLIGDRTPAAAAEALVEVALSRGGHDNITVIACRWVAEDQEVVPESEPPPPPPPVTPEDRSDRRLVLVAIGVALVLAVAALLAAGSLLDGVRSHRADPPSTEAGP